MFWVPTAICQTVLGGGTANDERKAQSTPGSVPDVLDGKR